MPLPQRGQLPPSCRKQSCLPLPARGTFPAQWARFLSLRIGKNSPVIHEQTPAAPPGNSSCSRQPRRAIACLLIPCKHPWARRAGFPMPAPSPEPQLPVSAVRQRLPPAPAFRRVYTQVNGPMKKNDSRGTAHAMAMTGCGWEVSPLSTTLFPTPGCCPIPKTPRQSRGSPRGVLSWRLAAHFHLHAVAELMFVFL